MKALGFAFASLGQMSVGLWLLTINAATGFAVFLFLTAFLCAMGIKH